MNDQDPTTSRSVVLERMWERVQTTKGESFVAHFYDLMYLGELVVKLTTVNLLATLESDRDRHRYRLEHKLVRATGIREWVQALDDLLTGPASQHRVQATAPAVREITQAYGSQESAWQVESVQLLQRVQTILEPSRSCLVGRTSLRQWFADFAWLRNRTRGHGALLPGPCEALVQDLEPSLLSIGQNLAILGLPSAFVRQNLSGKYRVSSICGPSDDFNRLKSDSSAQLQNGV